MDLSNIKFRSKYGSNEVLNLEIKAYFDGNPAVTAWCADGPYDTLTVNTLGIPDGCLAVRDDNHEYVKVLHDAGIVVSEDAVGSVPSGFITISFYQMSPEAIAATEEFLSEYCEDE